MLTKVQIKKIIQASLVYSLAIGVAACSPGFEVKKGTKGNQEIKVVEPGKIFDASTGRLAKVYINTAKRQLIGERNVEMTIDLRHGSQIMSVKMNLEGIEESKESKLIGDAFYYVQAQCEDIACEHYGVVVLANTIDFSMQTSTAATFRSTADPANYVCLERLEYDVSVSSVSEILTSYSSYKDQCSGLYSVGP